MWRLPRTPSLQRLLASVASLVPGGGSGTPSNSDAESTSSAVPSNALSSWLASRSASAATKPSIDSSSKTAVVDGGRGLRGLQARAQARAAERSLLEAVYGRVPTDPELFHALDTCPEFVWLAECAYRSPLPPGWQVITTRCRRGELKRRWVLEATGESSSVPPRLCDFARLGSFIAQARQSELDATEAAAKIRTAANEWIGEVHSLRSVWTGPFVDTVQQQEYYYCPATGVSSWESPCSASAYLAFVAENLLQSDVFAAVEMPCADTSSIETEMGDAVAQVAMAAARHQRNLQGNVLSSKSQVTKSVRRRKAAGTSMGDLVARSRQQCPEEGNTVPEWEDMMSYIIEDRRRRSNGTSSVASSQGSDNESSCCPSEQGSRVARSVVSSASSRVSDCGSVQTAPELRLHRRSKKPRRLPSLTAQSADAASTEHCGGAFGDGLLSPLGQMSKPSLLPDSEPSSDSEDEFAAELSGLRGTVARLEAKVAELQRGINQQTVGSAVVAASVLTSGELVQEPLQSQATSAGTSASDTMDSSSSLSPQPTLASEGERREQQAESASPFHDALGRDGQATHGGEGDDRSIAHDASGLLRRGIAEDESGTADDVHRGSSTKPCAVDANDRAQKEVPRDSARASAENQEGGAGSPLFGGVKLSPSAADDADGAAKDMLGARVPALRALEDMDATERDVFGDAKLTPDALDEQCASEENVFGGMKLSPCEAIHKNVQKEVIVGTRSALVVVGENCDTKTELSVEKGLAPGAATQEGGADKDEPAPGAENEERSAAKEVLGDKELEHILAKAAREVGQQDSESENEEELMNLITPILRRNSDARPSSRPATGAIQSPASGINSAEPCSGWRSQSKESACSSTPTLTAVPSAASTIAMQSSKFPGPRGPNTPLEPPLDGAKGQIITAYLLAAKGEDPAPSKEQSSGNRRLPALPSVLAKDATAFCPSPRSEPPWLTRSQSATKLCRTTSAPRLLGERLPPAPGAAPRDFDRGGGRLSGGSAEAFLARAGNECVGVTPHWVGLNDAALARGDAIFGR